MAAVMKSREPVRCRVCSSNIPEIVASVSRDQSGLVTEDVCCVLCLGALCRDYHTSGTPPERTDLLLQAARAAARDKSACRDITQYNNQSEPRIQLHPLPLWNVPGDKQIISLDSLANGDVICIWAPEHVVKLHSSEGEDKVLPFQLKVDNPQAVAVHKATGTVAIANVSTVTLYSLYGGQYRAKTIHTKLSPWAVGFSQAEIIIGAGNETSLMKYRSNGEKMWEERVEHAGTSPYMAVDDRIIVADLNKVHVYTQLGTKMFTIPSSLDEDAFLQAPSGVCTDSKNNILVADRDKQVVMLFNPVGMFVSVVVQVEGIPTDITLHKDKYLVVGTLDNGLCMYDVQGHI